MADRMTVSFRNNSQRTRYETLSLREMTFHFYPDHYAMGALGIAESVRYLTNQLGWDRFALSPPLVYRNLTLEFLSSFKYNPTHGTSIHKGFVTFRLFGNTYRLTTGAIADFLGVPHGPDAFTEVQDDSYMESELEYYWGSISGNPNAAPEARFSTKIHNPAIRYFYMIIAHTFFGKPPNNTTVTKEEIFLMFCVSQSRPVIAAAFLLSNFTKIIEDPTRCISIGGFVTFLAKALDLHTPRLRLSSLL
ncbi:hypothetical protein P8452_52715 [Trifolium repens]|nr:hypothetical protein P8452_52715 [Trifolium repens]